MVPSTLVRGDVTLAVTDWGGEGPPMVLIHGLTGTQHAWDAVVAKLAPQFRIATYDQRGHGESSRSVTYAWESLVDDLEAVVRHLELREVTLVGLSVGAGVALSAASRIDGCRAVAMIDGAFAVPQPAPDRPLPLKVYRAVRHQFHRGPNMSRVEVAQVGDAYRSRSPQFEMSLRSLNCPALYVIGTQMEPGRQGPGFQLAREETAIRSGRLNPRVRVEWLDAQHDMVQTHPHGVADALVRLYARTE